MVQRRSHEVAEHGPTRGRAVDLAESGRGRRDVIAVALAATLSLLLLGTPLAGQSYANELAARVWLDRGDQPLLQRGDQVRLYYRASRSSHVAVVHIDTNGTARMLLPRSPDDPAYVVGGRDYRLVFPRSSSWTVDEDPGKGYFFMIAAPTPLDLSLVGWDPYSRSWDLGELGRQVYSDPYVAMDDWVAALIPDWEYAPYALDFVEYDVGGTHEYPRFLCYDCHGFRPYQAWNPYLHSCTTFRVVIWDDPYFYPARRYVGQRVVWTRPVAVYQPRFQFKERAYGEPAVPLVRPSTARVVGPTNPVTGQPGRLQRRNAVDDGMVRVPSAERGRIQYRPGGTGTAAPQRPTGGIPGRGGATAVSPGATPAQPGVVPRGAPRTGPSSPATGERPSLRRRPSEGAAPAAGPAPRRGGGVSPPSARSGGTSTPRVVPPRRGGGAAASPARGGTTTRPSTRSSGPSRARPPATAPPRRTGGGAAVPRRATPPSRSGGGRAGSARPPARSGPPVRRAPPRRTGGGSARSAPPARRGGGGSPSA